MRKPSLRRAWLSAILLTAVLLTAGCSGDENGSATRGSTDFPARTLAAGTTAEAQSPGAATDASRIMLRLEGDAGVNFSGVCATGAENSVLVGQVPKTYSFDLQGQGLTCRIKKQSPGGGSLRAILLAGVNTRSIQQTESGESTINISYSAG